MATEVGRDRARASLLDRLVDLDPGSPAEPRPLRTHTKTQLREAVRRDLEWLLSTRCPVPAHQLDPRQRTVVDYGVPDLLSLAPQDPDAHGRLATLLEQTLAAFEPRLRRVRVSVRRVRTTGLDVRIEAALVIDHVTEPVSFSATVAGRGEPVTVEAHG